MNHDNNNTNYPITRFYKNYGLEKKKVLKWLSDMVMSDMGYTNSVCNLGQFACFDGRGCVPNENVRKFFISDFSKNTGYFFFRFVTLCSNAWTDQTKNTVPPNRKMLKIMIITK